jgi:hypothetical protein
MYEFVVSHILPVCRNKCLGLLLYLFIVNAVKEKNMSLYYFASIL